MKTKTKILISLILLSVADLIVPFPITAVILMYVLFNRPIWFEKYVKDIYRGSWKLLWPHALTLPIPSIKFCLDRIWWLLKTWQTWISFMGGLLNSVVFLCIFSRQMDLQSGQWPSPEKNWIILSTMEPPVLKNHCDRKKNHPDTGDIQAVQWHKAFKYCLKPPLTNDHCWCLSCHHCQG